MTDDKLFVPAGHFYSPLPSLDERVAAMERAKRNQENTLVGIEIDANAMVAVWKEIAPVMKNAPFGDNLGDGGFRYHYRNVMYSYGDASVYFGMVSRLKPVRIIEIGSGYSSALAVDMRDIFQTDIELTFIEPFPKRLSQLLREDDRATVIADKVQNVPLAVFDTLEPNDILFVDSSHVAKTGSDVCFEIFDILPRLKPGVVIHFHDCFWPFEYPQKWAVEENRAWNELYFLRAFLMYNRSFEIIFFNSYFALRHRKEAEAFDTPFLKNPGGGLWLRKKDQQR